MESKMVFLVGLYCIGSSVMLVLNKAATRVVPDTNILLFFQLISTVALAGSLHLSGRVKINLRPPGTTCAAYSAVALVFFVTLFANMKILEHAGVNAFIVIRSSTPIAVAVLDYLLMGRMLPSSRSATSILVTVLCCYGYVSIKPHDPSQRVVEWTRECTVWSVGWYAMFVFDQLFIKAIVDRFPATGWERTMYQNFFATVFAACFLGAAPPAMMIKHGSAAEDHMSWVLVGASCLCGGILSYASLTLRGEVSATMFTVLGVGCKMFSILLNEAFVESERDWRRLLVVSLAVLASAAYKQSPPRTKKADTQSAV